MGVAGGVAGGIAGRGRILVWEGVSMWVLQGEGELAQTDYHSHHALQVTLALEGEFDLRTEAQHLPGPAVAVAPDVRHIFRASGIMAFLFVEPESDAGRALTPGRGDPAMRALLADAARPHMRALAERFLAGADDAALAEAGKAILAALAGQPRIAPPDPRVRAMIDFAAANIEDAVSLPLAAGAAGLSPSRARHLFVEQTGLPFKTYVLWLRIQRAVELFAAGASLTEAAHEAGFADSAHLSRTFRRTFGLPAAALRVNSRFVQAEARPAA